MNTTPRRTRLALLLSLACAFALGWAIRTPSPRPRSGAPLGPVAPDAISVTRPGGGITRLRVTRAVDQRGPLPPPRVDEWQVVLWFDSADGPLRFNAYYAE